MDMKLLDPKGLMKDAYEIEGISEPECRSIFLDWALGLPVDADPQTFIIEVLTRYGTVADHPMTRVLKEGLSYQPAKPRRRGGRSERLRRT